MTLPGETLANGAPRFCEDCGRNVTVDVMHTPAGYYIGSYCACGPYSRESGYYRTRGEAKRAMDEDLYTR